MAVAGCYLCIKYLVFAFNFVFWLLGCGLLAVGLWAKYSPETLKTAGDKAQNAVFNKFFDEMTDSNQMIIYFIIALGAIIMVIGFLGCCGAIKESKFLLGMFFVFLLIIFTALLALGIYIVVHKDKVKEHIGRVIEDKLKNSEKGDDDAINFMVTLQTQFKCCGAMYGIDDYAIKSDRHCQLAEYDIACVNEMYKIVKAYGSVLSGVAIGVALVMILGMIFSMLLCCAIREQV